ncbi:right-handed parallel beta-helix repeat-containing protein [Candidatus Bathyarchaeota archaeon]|nr:right-handed parallel beta-helix repeat-containing protein [Candidatus Bathyarchaeota archaeon]
MLKFKILCFMLSILLSAQLLTNSVSPVEAYTIIYIRSNGNIEPPSANIMRVDNTTYRFTGNNSAPIYVQRNNIVVDGAGYTLHGPHSDYGIRLEPSPYDNSRTNVTVRNLTIKGFTSGGILINYGYKNIVIDNLLTENQAGIVIMQGSANNTILHNTVVNNTYGLSVNGWSNNITENEINSNLLAGISFFGYGSNSLVGNNIVDNRIGEFVNSSGLRGSIDIAVSPNNKFYHNNIIEVGAPTYPETSNTWDNGYPSGGNYWSSYVGQDLLRGFYQNITGADGIGDTAYTINSTNVDHYPLIYQIGTVKRTFRAYSMNIDTSSNATFTGFTFNSTTKQMKFNSAGKTGTVGSINITFPTQLLGGPYAVLLDDSPVTPVQTGDSAHTTFRVILASGSHAVKINGVTAVPEFPSVFTIVPLLSVLSALLLHFRRKLSSCPKGYENAL